LAKADGAIDVGSCDSAAAAGSDDARRIDVMLTQGVADRWGQRNILRRWRLVLMAMLCLRRFSRRIRWAGWFQAPENRSWRCFSVSIQQNFCENSICRRRYFLGDLVGLEFDNWIVLRDAIADFFQPSAYDNLCAFLLERDDDVDHGK
jgi:hypothetical protein